MDLEKCEGGLSFTTISNVYKVNGTYVAVTVMETGLDEQHLEARER